MVHSTLTLCCFEFRFDYLMFNTDSVVSLNSFSIFSEHCIFQGTVIISEDSVLMIDSTVHYRIHNYGTGREYLLLLGTCSLMF